MVGKMSHSGPPSASSRVLDLQRGRSLVNILFKMFLFDSLLSKQVPLDKFDDTNSTPAIMKHYMILR